MDISAPDKASSSSPFSKGWLYDVFISFRGEDTRKNFTGHLYEALKRAGINAFIDDEELKKGEDLKTKFERAIQGSKISIIIFSRQYANSHWCLEELVKIMECRRTLEQLVLPIFYDVDPSHVRKQTDSFGQLFLEHIDEKKVERWKEERWRTALTEASNLSGWDLKNTLDGHEAKFIKMITEEVTRKLNNTYLDVAPYQVGLDSRMQDISNYLLIGDSDDVRMIGILGMGGIGKTTIAKAIYNKFCERFEGKCFLAKVRENKLEKLQKQLLSDILQMTKKEVSSVAAGTALVRQRFRRLKVLVIVDDVDDVKQLRELAGNCHSFGPGSRIIITTRNERVLKEFAVEKIYRAKGLDQEEALELVIWHAFRSSCCPSQYLEVAREVVNYCGGVPLALQVLGSHLFNGSIGYWKSTLDKLKQVPPDKIQEQLKISYDGLNDDYEREIFCDVSCFFIGMDRNDVMQILDGCGFYATTGIKVLLDRCLVTVNTKNKIMMHDLLRDMGRDIVRAENSKFPRERSRLWRPEDVKAVLIDKSGTEKIEGLALNLPSAEETNFSIEAFRNMKRLRLLQLNYVRLTGGYQCLSKKLRWLCWHGFPLEFLPIELCQPNIVAIDMRYSNLKQVLCEYYGLLGKLKILNLSHSHDLTQSPDFSKFPNLEKLILKDCKRLAKVHKSIGDLKSLVLVNLKDCETLKALPRSFYKLKSVKTLVLDGCTRFRSLSEHLGKMASLVTLYADGTAIKKVPPSIVRLEKLECLSLSYLKCPLQLSSLRGLCSLTILRLADNNLMEVPNDIGSSLPCLVELHLDNNNFRSLPSLSGLSMLRTLYLDGCRNLVEIIDLPKSLDMLEMDDCSALERMPDFSGMSTLVSLTAPKLIEFPGLDSALNSGLAVKMLTHNNVIDFLLKDSTLQGWRGRGYMNLVNLVGRQIPTWFNHVNKGTQVSFEVPKEIGCNAKALAVCLACVPHDDVSSFDSEWTPRIYVINHTWCTKFCVDIRDVFTFEENLWLGNLSLSETEFNLEEGDLVHVIADCPEIVVKKIGVRLVCDKLITVGDLYFSYHSIPYEWPLEEISTEDVDFDEDYEVDDFDEEFDEDDDYDDEEDQDGDANDEDDDNDDDYGLGVMSQVKDSDDEPVAHSLETDKPETGSIESIGGGGEDEEEEPVDEPEDPMDFCTSLKQPRSNLLHKMSIPELCRNFSPVAWCGKLNVIACASETCASIPSSNANAPFWIPIHIVIPERSTECAAFNVNADSPRDSVQFIEWSPTSCPRALLIANFHGRVTIWTQPSQGPANLVRDASRWQQDHEWQQDIAVVTKWLSGVSPYRWLSSKSSTSSNAKSTFEEKFLSQQSQNSARWPSFLCICSVFSSGSVQLHWSQYPPNQTSAAPKWFQTSKGLLGAGPSGIMAADAIITDSGAMHVAGVPIVNPSTVVVWEVTPGIGNGFHTSPKISTTNGVPPSINPPNWAGFSPLAAYLFSWQDYLISEAKQGQKQTDPDFSATLPLHCSPVSNFSAYVSPEAASQSATTTTWGSGVTAVAFDPTRGGSVIAVVIVEGQYMSPYDPDEGPSITGWRVQRWESSLQPVVLHQIFGNPTSSFGGQAPMQTVWQSKVDTSIQPTNDFKSHQAAAMAATIDARKTPDSSIEKVKRVSFDPFDLPSDVRTLARIVYSAHGGEIAVAFLRGGVHIFSGPNFAPVDNYQINVGSAIATPAFSSTSCCSASVWHDSAKDRTVLKIIRVLPPAVPSSQVKANSSTWERAIAERFWWSLLVGVDWWDAVGCTQSAAEDGIVSLNSVIAVLDADFHSLPSTQHRQQYGPSLDRIKCRLLEGTNAQEVRAMVLDMQARLLLDMLGKGIESALINPSALVPEPWQASGEMLSGIDPEAMAIEPALVPHIQAYVDAVLDLASHFITRLRRYASFCRTLASHAVTAGAGSNRNMVASPTQSSASPATSQGGQSGTTNSTGNTQMQAWVQGAIAKISSTSDGVSNSTPNPISGPSSFMPISINTGTFPGTPAVRLIGDCHFLHRLCQLLLFCFFFRRTQLPRFSGGAQRNADANMQKPQPGAPGKVEEVSSVSAKSSTTMVRPEEGHIARPSQIPGAKGVEEGPAGRSRLGAGNAGQGYTFEEVKVLFLILMDLCRRTASLAHPLPVSQVGSSNIQVRLHYIDGNYTVLPEVVEASLGPHMQNMPRPRGADAAGLLLRELELHPPAEEWHRRNMYGGPWSDPDDMGPQDDTPKLCNSSDLPDSGSLESCDVYYGAHGLWPRKRRMSERDAAFGLNTSVGLGAYLGIMGSRRDVVTAVWKTGLEGVWYKCIRCLRQTSAFASPDAATAANQTGRETWWISRWAYCCPMCGGTWVRVV